SCIVLSMHPWKRLGDVRSTPPVMTTGSRSGPGAPAPARPALRSLGDGELDGLAGDGAVAVGARDLRRVLAGLEVGRQLVAPQVHPALGDAAAVDELLLDGDRVGPQGADLLRLALHLLGALGLLRPAVVDRDGDIGAGRPGEDVAG